MNRVKTIERELAELYDKIIDTVIRECDADYDQMIEVRDEKALKRKLRKIIKPFLSAPIKKEESNNE